MGEVVIFDGETILDIPVSRVLDSAQKLTEVRVLGWDGEEFCILSSSSSTGNLLTLLELGKNAILSRFYE
jgi:hypothetical protein